jgi:hypothetical protein
MKQRITRLPIVQLALVAVSMLVGLALAPVAAQTAAGLDGQITVRSDGAVYLIQNGQRRWVATVVITDDELNAYPEAEPIFTAMAPFGGGSAGSSGTGAAPKPAAAASPAPAAPAASAPAAPAASAGSGAGQTKPVGDACPAGSEIKGATTGDVKTYYEPDRPEYASIKPEVCFTAGGDARNAGYTSAKR